MITMGAPDDTAENLATTEGRPPAGMEIRITDEQGKPLPYGVEGEVRLRGEAVCQGYLDAGANGGGLRRGRVPDHRGPRPGHRRAGTWSLTGRLKDIIIRKGENISAKEIEDLLHRAPGRRGRGGDRAAGRGARGTRLRGGRTAGRGRAR